MRCACLVSGPLRLTPLLQCSRCMLCILPHLHTAKHRSPLQLTLSCTQENPAHAASRKQSSPAVLSTKHPPCPPLSFIGRSVSTCLTRAQCTHQLGVAAGASADLSEGGQEGGAVPGVPAPGQDAQALHGCPGRLRQQRQQRRRHARSAQQRCKQRWRPADASPQCSRDMRTLSIGTERDGGRLSAKPPLHLGWTMLSWPPDLGESKVITSVPGVLIR